MLKDPRPSPAGSRYRHLCIACLAGRRFYQIFGDLKATFPYVVLLGSLSGGFIDRQNKLLCYTDHQIFERFHKSQVRSGFARKEAISKELLQLQPGDYVTHRSWWAFMQAWKTGCGWQDTGSGGLKYKDGDLLYVNINSLHKISKFSGKDGATQTQQAGK